MPEFQPIYLQQGELGSYGLPDPAAKPDIMGLIGSASVIMDTLCQTKDGAGYGSLAYSTYTERKRVRSTRNANVFRLSHRPLVGLSAASIAGYAASGGLNAVQATPEDSLRLNGSGGELCALLALSGRYGNARNGASDLEVMLPYMIPQNSLQGFGGPPPWYAMAPAQADYNPASGEVWAPPGIYWCQFSEIAVTYTAGFDPLNMPRPIKICVANIVKNMLTKPIPGVRSANFTDAALVMQFASTWLDDFTQGLMQPYIRVMYS